MIAAVQRALQQIGQGPLYDALHALEQAIGSNSSSSSSVGGAAFILRPGVPSSGNAYATEAELLAAIATIDAPLVGFDLSNVPGPFPKTFTLTQPVWEMRGGTWFSTYNPSGFYTVIVPEGVQVKNLFALRQGIGVALDRTATPGFVWTEPVGAPARVIGIAEGSILDNVNVFPGLGIVNPGDPQFIVSIFTSGTANASGGPLVKVSGNAFVGGVSIASSANLNQGFRTGWIESVNPGDGVLSYIIADASFTQPPIPGFTGLSSVDLIDRADATTYNDVLVPPLLGAATVQEAIDVLKVRGSTIAFGAASVTDPTVSFLLLAPGFLVGPAISGASGMGVRIAHDQTVSTLRASHIGNALNNAAATTTYTLFVNNVLVATTTAMLGNTPGPTPVTGSESAPFTINLVPGDLVQVRSVQAGYVGGDPGVTDMLVGIG